MQKRRLLGLSLVVIGLVIILSKPLGITGAVIGLDAVKDVWFYVVGLAVVGVGMVFMSGDNLDTIIAKKDPALLRDLEIIRAKINSQKDTYAMNSNFVKGLNTIRGMVESERERFLEADKDKRAQNTIKERVHEWIEALDRRESTFFDIASSSGREEVGESQRNAQRLEQEALARGYLVRNAKGKAKGVLSQRTKTGKIPLGLPELSERISKREVSDVPDWGLYDYRPLSSVGGKRKQVELRVVHYTENDARKDIEKKYRKAKTSDERIFLPDKTGWAYFVDQRLPEEKFSLGELRNLVGTGHQDYVKKMKHVDPKSFLQLKVRVPSERIFFKDTIYNDKGAVVKYGDRTPVSIKDLKFYNSYERLKGSKKHAKGLELKRGNYSAAQWNLLEDISKGLGDRYFQVRKYAIAGGINLGDIKEERVFYAGSKGLEQGTMITGDLDQIWSGGKRPLVSKSTIVNRKSR